ncbi:MAG: TetR/AcrR family transcriptional regulator [Acidobacteria bacterium]|nr:TetR/AcrR family transcriptional regulator [Acidobacteriota bacterium]
MPKIVDHDERRQQHLEALWRLLERDGAGAISIRHLAEEAGESKSNIATYFPSRTDILYAAVSQVWERNLQRASSLDLTDGSLATAVEAVMIAIPDSPERRRQASVWMLLLAENTQSPEARELLATLDGRVRRAVRTALGTWQSTGLVHVARDLDLEAMRLHALIDGLSLHTLHTPDGIPADRLRAIVNEHLSDLAGPPRRDSH